MNSDNEDFYTDNEETYEIETVNNDNEQLYTIQSQEYINYKRNILSLHTKVLERPFYKQYYIKDYKQVNIFANTIKEYGNNLPIIENHYIEIGNDLIKSNKPALLSNIKLIEYSEYETDDYTSLIELIDGHHRVRAMCFAFSEKSNLKLSIDVEIYKSDKPDSIKTDELFKKLNIVKPFISDLEITDVSRNIIDELNKIYKSLPLIKNTNTDVNRPRISQVILNQIIVKRLLKLKENNIFLSSLNINKIINEFKKYNDMCKNKVESWFKKNTLFPMNKNIKIPMLEKAEEHECFLGLVNLEKLVDLCVN